MNLLIKNIKTLVGIQPTDRTTPLRGAEMTELNTISNAFLFIENDKIADFGSMDNCPIRADKTIDATGKMVFPTWCDSHTHLVFAGSREGEFEDRINGLSYQEIAKRGGGILNSARRLQKADEEELLEAAWQRLNEVKNYGTGVIEIKSGYGLTVESELKMLRIIRRLKEKSDMGIKASFLGAHALPLVFKDNREGYIQLIIKEMLPKIAGEELADYVDVFCEKVAFSVEETERIMEAAANYGLKPKQNSNTIATLLPSAPFFINDHYPPARQLLKANLPVALATDFNPGSTPSGRMPFVLSLACIKLRMTPSEAINAATFNGACALEWQQEYGSISKGKIANFFITKPMSSIAYLPYAFGSDLVEQVFIKGKY